MRICYLCADRGISLAKHNGASAHFRSLVRALTALGHEVLVITPSTDGNGDLGVPVIPIPIPETLDALLSDARRRVATNHKAADWARMRLAHALGHLWNNVAVEQVLRDVLPGYHPDLLFEVYSPFGVAGGIMAKRMGIRHILNVHAPLAWEGKEYRQQALQEAAEALEQMAFTSPSLIVTVSRELREHLLAAGVIASKVEVVPNGVDVDMFTPQGQAYRQGLEGKVVIGFVGSLKAWHGVDILVEAFRQLAADPCFHLLIVGDGPEAKVFHALAEEFSGRVTLVGAVPQAEVPAYIRAMDVAVAPYPRLKPFYFSPLKVLEYMAAGRAIVAARIGQISDLIRDGETGLLVPPEDGPALVDAVQRLVADQGLCHAVRDRAAAEARGTHTWAQRASQIVDLAQAMP